MLKLLTILVFPICLYSQSIFKMTNGINIISTNDPIVNLYNTNLNNASSNNDFNDGTIWSLTGTSAVTGTPILKFHGLRLNNTAGFTLTNNTNIYTRLDMISGNINTAGYVLEIGNASNPGNINWTNGTVIGPLKRWFAASINSSVASGIFPIGNDATNRNVMINYTQAPTQEGYIVAEYKNGIPTQVDDYAGLPLWSSDGQVIQNYENSGYFEITPNDYNGSLNNSEYTLKIRGVNLQNVNDFNTLRLIKNPGPSHTSWIAAGNHNSVSGINSDFTITSTNVHGFSWFNIGGNDNNPLPVELLYFDGTKYPNFNVLKWATASEHNSSHFVIEQSLDAINWIDMCEQLASGNSNETQNYSCIDAFAEYSIHYYRLIQYDIDGNYKIYDPIAIDNNYQLKKITGYVNLLGQQVSPEVQGIIFEVYEDGTSKKIIR